MIKLMEMQMPDNEATKYKKRFEQLMSEQNLHKTITVSKQVGLEAAIAADAANSSLLITDISAALAPSFAPEGKPVEVQDTFEMSVKKGETVIISGSPRGEIPGVVNCDEFGSPNRGIPVVAMDVMDPLTSEEKSEVKILAGGAMADSAAVKIAERLEQSGYPVKVANMTEPPNQEKVLDAAGVAEQIKAMEKMIKNKGISKKQQLKIFGSHFPKIKTSADEEAIRAAQAKRDRRAAKMKAIVERTATA